MNEKVILGIKEEAEQKIKSLEKLDPDFVLSWLGGLTDLEQKIISAMYMNNKALTIKDIINSLIENTFSVFTSSNFLPTVHHWKEFDFPFSNYYPIEDGAIKQEIDNTKRHSLKEKIDFLKGIKFPSFRRIDKCVQDLMAMGIVLAREGKSENKKIKGLYFLNPIIRTQLNKIKVTKDFSSYKMVIPKVKWS